MRLILKIFITVSFFSCLTNYSYSQINEQEILISSNSCAQKSLDNQKIEIRFLEDTRQIIDLYKKESNFLQLTFLLKNIKTLYLKEKGKYKDISEIRANADLIFENIENEIWEILEGSSNLNSELPIETLNIAILIVMVDAFMRCKILEEPIMQ